MMNNIMKPNEAPKAYARNQVNEIWTLEKFSKHIAEHNGVFSRGTVKGVLSDMCECLVEQLLNGNKIQLGELGTFGISISSNPAESMEKFTAKNIKAVNILFTPGVDFDNLLGRSEFNLVASRIAQSAVLKAEKKMVGSVDLDALKKKDNASADDDANGSKPGEGDAPNSGKDDKDTGSGSTTPTTPPSSGNTNGGDSEEA